VTLEVTVALIIWGCLGMAVIGWAFPDGLGGAYRYLIANSPGPYVHPALLAAIMTPVMLLGVAVWPMLAYDLIRNPKAYKQD
jgi:Na+/proline symporter